MVNLLSPFEVLRIGIGLLARRRILLSMIDVLKRNRFLVEEQAGLLKTSFRYDVRDPESGEILLQCREGALSKTTSLFRMTEYRRTTPFDVRVYTPDDALVMRVTRGVPVFSSRVRVVDAEDVPIGGFRQKVFSFASVFDVVDARNQSVCSLKGKASGTEFRFLTPDGATLARVTKKWAGTAKELFTNADHYLLEIDEAVPMESTIRQLIVSSALCIGLVVKLKIP